MLVKGLQIVINGWQSLTVIKIKQSLSNLLKSVSLFVRSGGIHFCLNIILSLQSNAVYRSLSCFPQGIVSIIRVAIFNCGWNKKIREMEGEERRHACEDALPTAARGEGAVWRRYVRAMTRPRQIKGPCTQPHWGDYLQWRRWLMCLRMFRVSKWERVSEWRTLFKLPAFSFCIHLGPWCRRCL